MFDSCKSIKGSQRKTSPTFPTYGNKVQVKLNNKVEQKWQKSREVNKLRDVDQDDSDDDDDNEDAADDWDDDFGFVIVWRLSLLFFCPSSSMFVFVFV